MSSDWSLLLPGLIIAVVAGASVGGSIDLSRRVEGRRKRRRAFREEGPIALSSAHDLLAPPLPKDPTSLVPPETLTRGLREQVARLERGTGHQRRSIPAIAMLLEVSRALEDMSVRGRVLDLRVEEVMAASPQSLEPRLVHKLVRQAIQKDPSPAAAIPSIDNPEAQAALVSDPAFIAEIVRYRRAQQLLHDARDAFVDHWWVVRDLRLAAQTRLASARHEGGEHGRRSALAIHRELNATIAEDFRRNWPRIDRDLQGVEAVELTAPIVEVSSGDQPKGPAARPGRTQL